MAAPATARRYSFRFRDSKGNVAHMRFLIGAATVAAADGDAVTLLGHLQAISNAHVSRVDAFTPDYAYGSTAEYETVEDKAAMTFLDQQGKLHRFQVPAPIATDFKTDKETVNSAQADVANVITDIGTFVYGAIADTSPMAYVGGIRVRRRFQRKFNVFTLDPTLSGEGE